MRVALTVLLIAALGSACASSQPPGTASVTPSSPAPASIPPPAPAAPPLITPRMDNEEQAVRDVNARLARASQLVAQIDATKLSSDQQEMLSGLRDFISKANDALQARDVPRAKVLADKASRLADDLAVAVKKTR